jgi:enoyl-[acyl-carrier-protein] reductase (NADH)
MSEARVRVKVNLFHDVRNRDKDVSEIENRIEERLNWVNDIAHSVRIAPGYQAGAIFITLSNRKFSIDDITSRYRISEVVERSIEYLSDFGYASNIGKSDVRIDAVTVE